MILNQGPQSKKNETGCLYLASFSLVSFSHRNASPRNELIDSYPSLKQKTLNQGSKFLRDYSNIWGNLFLFFAFFFTYLTTEAQNSLISQKGFLDAQQYFGSKPTLLYLDGEWEFYPNKLYSPEDIKHTSATGYIQMPSMWGKMPDGSQIKYATYVLTIVNHGLPEIFAIRNHKIFSSFKLYLNGEVIMQDGIVSSYPAIAQPSYYPQSVNVHFDTNTDTLKFVLQISNHNFNRGGVSESFLIGHPESIQRNNMAGTGFEFFLVGSLLIMALYYLSLFYVLKKDLSSLYFSIFIFIAILRIMVTGQRLILHLYPGIPWDTLTRLEFISLYLAPVFFILFFNNVFREEVKIYVVNSVMLVSALFTAMVLITPPLFFSSSLIYFQMFMGVLAVMMIYWLWKASIKNKEGALILLLGIILLFATMLHDLVFAHGSLRGNELFPAGIFLFILCQSYVLSIKFSVINKENQQLWEELDFKSQNLEELVQARTAELEEQSRLLQLTNHELAQKKQILEKQSGMMEDINELLEKEKEKSDQLLLNVLPKAIAEELRLFGKSLAHSYPRVSVLFVDFVSFSELSEKMHPSDLLEELHFYFTSFDEIAIKYNLEKIKTIGDAYLCAGGLHDHTSEQDVINTVLAAMEIISFIKEHREEKTTFGEMWFDCRLGIHTGPVIAGVVGKSKFAFDIWGPTVNIAKRMEAASEPGKVNISEDTFECIKDNFECTSRGIITMKHKKNMKMFFVDKVIRK